MSGGFSFPPPPPPPPSNNNSANNQWQPGSSERGRGGRGRGHRGRGRGDNIRQQQSHGGNRQANASGHPPPTFSQLPAGSYVNPAFAPVQTGYATNSGSSQPIPRTAAGHKRKLDALRGPQQKKVNGPPTAPAVPSFGAPIVPTVPSNVEGPKQIQKPRGNTLGLTPASGPPVEYSSSDNDDEDEDIDEEAVHAELGTKLTFEHNGTILALKTAADIAKWQQERKQKFPTTARIAEREVERIKTGEERRRLLAAASRSIATAPGQRASRVTRKPTAVQRSPATPPPEETELEKTKRSLSEKTAEVDRLRQQVSSGQERIRRAQEAEKEAASSIPNIPLIDGSYYDESDSSEVLSDSSVISPDSSELEDSDGAPEETASKPASTAQTKRRPCRYFVASGHCRDGDSCQFYHDPMIRAREARKGRERAPLSTLGHKRAEKPVSKKGIFDRLVQQEQEEMDRLTLKVIKYLGKTGLFKDVGNSE